MEQDKQSDFSVITTTKSSKKSKSGLIIGTVVVLFLAISIPIGVYLVKQQQDIREKAAAATVCPIAEACPVAGAPALLRSCYSISVGGTPREISCSTVANVGEIASCGSSQYCCPSLGASWTKDISLCSTPSPSPSLSPSPSSTATASASPSIRATSTASASGTMAPIPVTGTNWPTVLGVGLGILVIVGSVLLIL